MYTMTYTYQSITGYTIAEDVDHYLSSGPGEWCENMVDLGRDKLIVDDYTDALNARLAEVYGDDFDDINNIEMDADEEIKRDHFRYLIDSVDLGPIAAKYDYEFDGSLITTREAADRDGVTTAVIRARIRRGEITAVKIGRRWMIQP